jgi:uncharacterized repeat protein (TIGR01451 family)
MHSIDRRRWLAAAVIVAFVANLGAIRAAPAALASTPVVKGPPLVSVVSPIKGPPGFSMAEPVRAAPRPVRPITPPRGPILNTYTHTPPVDSSQNLPPGSGPIMPKTTIYYDFWLPTGNHFESNAAGDLNYENLLIRFAQDLGGSQFHNLVTQYSGSNGTISNTVTYGGMWVDTGTAYPHAGGVGTELQDSDIQTEVHNAVTTNGWSEGANSIIAVFTANNINECMSGGSPCTDSATKGFCAYHDHFSDSGTDTIYAYMSFDHFTHYPGQTCVAGQTAGDNDPNAGVYPNGDQSADAEVNTFSHELIESETDPHPNATWTGPNGEIGDACNFTFSPRNDNGADVYLNGDPYIVQEEWSNAPATCAIDLPTNGFCSGSVSNVCAPATTFTKAANTSSPYVTRSVTYTLTLNNPSPTAAESNLSVSDTLPGGYLISNVSAPSATSSSNSSTSATVTYDTLAVNQSRTITITATVPKQAGITATNCGSLDGGDLIGTALTTQPTSPCASTTPIKIPTAVTYTGPTSGDYNDSVTLTATLTDTTNSSGLGSESLNFSLGAEGCSNVLTDPGGHASCTVTPTDVPGPYTVNVSFAGDDTYAASSTNPGFTLNRDDTQVISPGTLTVHYHDPVTVSAQLVDPADATEGEAAASGIGGSRTVTFTLGGTDTCSGTTDPSGNASCSLTPHVTGSQPLVASFAGDTYYLPSSRSDPFSVTPEETTMTYTGPTVILAGASGATLTATLIEEGANNHDGDGGSPGPIPAETVTLSLGSQSCTGVTDAVGNVSCTIPSVSVPLGPEPVGSSFAGDAYYQPASDSTTAIVFAFPSRGAFTLGDKTVAAAGPATTLTWWADTWWKLNSLTGGSASASFKGFVDTIRLPTTSPANICSGTWTTDPGNSPPPTAGVPSYMGVVVPGSVTKSGSTVTGNYGRIVVVKVNPGYAPNPANHGTGKIVATFCHT